MSYLSFDAVEDVLAFLRYQRKASQKREWTKVHVGSGCYALAFPLNDWQPPATLFGGTVKKDSPIGAAVDLDALLRGIWLTEWKARLRRPADLVLAVTTAPGSSADKRREAQAALHTGWRALPRTTVSTSQFFTALREEEGIDAIMITDVATSFDYRAFLQEQRFPQMRVFAREYGREGEPFVECGYHYPCMEALKELQGGESAGGLWLCYAGQRVHSSGAANFHESCWFQLPSVCHSIGETLYFTAEKSEAHPESIVCRYDELERQQLEVPLVIDGTDRSVGAQQSLDARVAVLERELEILHTRRDRRRQMMEGEFIPIYVWTQDFSEGRFELPGTFQAFLDRPLAELEHFQYFCHPETSAGQWWHFVIASSPMPAGQALAAACDHVFLQDARWAEWALPLFVRSDCSLSADIGELDIAEKLREHLGLDKMTTLSAVLVAPCTGLTGDVAPGSPRYYHVTNTEQLMPLKEALQWANEHGQGPRAATVLAKAELSAANLAHEIDVQESTLRLDAEITERAAGVLAETEHEWEEFRKKAQAQLATMRLGDVLLEATEQPYAEAGKSWVQFVNGVVAINEAIALAKLTQLKEWNSAEKQRVAGLEQVAQSQTDVGERITETRQAVAELLAHTTQANEQLEGDLQALRKARTALDAANEQFTQQVAVLTDERRGHDKAIAENEAAIGQATEEVTRLNARRAKATQTVEKLTEARGRLEDARQSALHAEHTEAPAAKALEAELHDGARMLGLRVEKPLPPEVKRGFWARMFRK